ncbi:MAG: hypothetical protein OXR73_27545 [Myxococcales bacterium]|nr:hypothetical protein [Myxococcales bacterium]
MLILVLLICLVSCGPDSQPAGTSSQGRPAQGGNMPGSDAGLLDARADASAVPGRAAPDGRGRDEHDAGAIADAGEGDSPDATVSHADTKPGGKADAAAAEGGPERDASGEASEGGPAARAPPIVGRCVRDGAARNAGRVAWLPFRIVDAEYSAALDRVVAVVTPDRAPPGSFIPSKPQPETGCALALLDPIAGTFTTLALPRPGHLVSLSPDGVQVVVGHDGLLSVFDLDRREMKGGHPVIDTEGKEVDLFDVVHGGNGYAYVSPRRASGVSFPLASMTAVDLATGEQLRRDGHSLDRPQRLAGHPSGSAVYALSTDISPTSVERWDVSGGVARLGRRSASCSGGLWPLRDRDRLITGCGVVVATTADPPTDMGYRGTIAMPYDYDPIVYLTHADHFPAGGHIATIPTSGPSGVNREVVVLEDVYLTPRQRLPLPSFTVDDRTYATLGRYVFFAADGQQLAVVVEAGAAEVGELSSDTGDGGEHGLVLFDVAPGAVLRSPPDDPPVTSGADAVALNLAVVHADHSDAREEIVIVADDPPELVALDPRTFATSRIPLPLAPTSVWLDQAGQTAVVGHAGWVTVIDLRGPAIEEVLPVSLDVLQAVATDRYLHAISANSLASLELASLKEIAREIDISSRGTGYPGPGMTLHPDNARLYIGGSVTRSSRYDVSSGPAMRVSQAQDEIYRHPCSPLHLDEDGARIFTACGGVLRVDPDPALDFGYLGRLRPAASLRDPIIALDHASRVGLAAALPTRGTSSSDRTARVLRFYSDPYMQLHASRNLPPLQYEGKEVDSDGQFVFFSTDRGQAHVLVRADAPARRGYGLVTMAVPAAPDAPPALSTPVASSRPGFEVLPYRVADAAFTDVLDTIVLLPEDEPALYLIEGDDGAQQRIELPLPGRAVSIAPSGTTAAVGHDGWVSLIDLALSRVQATHRIALNARAVALGDDGWVYALEEDSQDSLRLLNVNSGEQRWGDAWVSSGFLVLGQHAMRHDSTVLYVGSNFGLRRVRVGAGVASEVAIPSAAPVCSRFGFLDDGSRAVTGCGSVLQIRDDPALDAAPIGMLNPAVSPIAFDHAASTRTIGAVASGTELTNYRDELHLFDDTTLESTGKVAVPDFVVDGESMRSTTRWLFLNRPGDVAFLVVRESRMVGEDALVTIPL